MNSFSFNHIAFHWSICHKLFRSSSNDGHRGCKIIFTIFHCNMNISVHIFEWLFPITSLRINSQKCNFLCWRVSKFSILHYINKLPSRRVVTIYSAPKFPIWTCLNKLWDFHRLKYCVSKINDIAGYTQDYIK